MTTANTALDQLKALTTVVADTGDFERMKQFAPQDATTNPSLILKAVQQPSYQQLVQTVRAANPQASVAMLMDRILIAFGLEILKIVPGRVSTEVDARLSFDTPATITKAKELIALYAAHGVDRNRVLIKLASTWEGIEAAKVLEAEGIHCNMTLLFSLVQAAACGKAKAQLISPLWAGSPTGIKPSWVVIGMMLSMVGSTIQECNPSKEFTATTSTLVSLLRSWGLAFGTPIRSCNWPAVIY